METVHDLIPSVLVVLCHFFFFLKAFKFPPTFLWFLIMNNTWQFSFKSIDSYYRQKQ